MATLSMNAFAALNDSDSDNEGPSKPVQAPRAAKPKGQLSKSAARRAKKKEVKNKTQLNTSAAPNKGAFNAQGTVSREDTKRSKDSSKKTAGAGGRGREFDRHVSGTGRGKEGKKGGAGKHNWGKEGEGDEEAAADAKAAAKDGEEDGAAEVEEEEEDNSMTYEDYVKQQAAARAELGDAFKPRQTRQATTFSKTVIEKNEEQEAFLGELMVARKQKGRAKNQKENKGKPVMWTAKPRRRDDGFDGERRGRGRGRGRGGSRGGRGGRRDFDGERRGPRRDGDGEGRRGGRGGSRGGRGGGRGGRGGRSERGRGSGGKGGRTPDLANSNAFPKLG